MDVILLERIEKLGHIGDVVKVKNGYARNFLLPRGKALRANDANRQVFEANRTKIEADNAERRQDAEKGAKSIEGASVQLIRQASNTGQLYGSVSARDLAEALEAKGHKVAKHQIVLDRPIKAIGLHEVRVALHPTDGGVPSDLAASSMPHPPQSHCACVSKREDALTFVKPQRGYSREAWRDVWTTESVESWQGWLPVRSVF